MNYILFKGQGVSITKIQNDLKLASNTLYRYAKNERRIDNMPYYLMRRLGEYFGYSTDEIYKKIKEQQIEFSKRVKK